MIYRSNIKAPDLQPFFKDIDVRPMGHSFGHSVISGFADLPADDPQFGIYKRCGWMTHDEAAILYECARLKPGAWLSIGAHLGWDCAHLNAAGSLVVAVEPMLSVPAFRRRFESNVEACDRVHSVIPEAMRSDEFFLLNRGRSRFAGVVIDGDHNSPWPLNDAVEASIAVQQHGVILMHDFWGQPVQEAVMWLIMLAGYRCRIYSTPHGLACCWKGNFSPPFHIPDPAIDWVEIRGRTTVFDWSLAE